jgi:hypothetical protein
MSKIQTPDLFNYKAMKDELIAGKVGTVRIVAPGKNGKGPFLGFFLNKPIVMKNCSPNIEPGTAVKILSIIEHPSLFLVTVTTNIED